MRFIGEKVFPGGNGLRLLPVALAILVFFVVLNAASAEAQEAVAGEATARAGDANTGATARAGDAKATAGDVGGAASERAGSTTRVEITISNGEETTVIRRSQATDDTQSTGQADGPLAEEATISVSDDAGEVDRVVIEAATNCDLQVQDDASVVIRDSTDTLDSQVTISNTDNVFRVNEGRLIITGPGGDDLVADGIENVVAGTGRVVSSLDISCGDDGDGDSTIQNATSNGQEDICSGGRVVAAFEDNESGRTEAFEIEGEKFFVRFDTAVEDGEDDGSTRISVRDDGGDEVESVTAEDGDDGRLEVGEGPGDFFLRIANENQDYEIDVVDCTGPTRSDVIKSTIPKKTLADTGGPAVGAMVAGLILAAGGLLMRASLRRGP